MPHWCNCGCNVGEHNLHAFTLSHASLWKSVAARAYVGSTDAIETKTKYLHVAVETMLPINQVKLPVEEQMFKPID